MLLRMLVLAVNAPNPIALLVLNLLLVFVLVATLVTQSKAMALALATSVLFPIAQPVVTLILLHVLDAKKVSK